MVEFRRAGTGSIHEKIACSIVRRVFLIAVAPRGRKTRIGFPDFAAQFGSLPLAQKKGFLQEQDLQAEVIRMNATVGIAALANGEIDYYPDCPALRAARGADKGRGLLRAQRSVRAHRPS